MNRWVALLTVLSLPAFAGLTEKVELHCKVTKVDKDYVKGLNEGRLGIFVENVDHPQPEGLVSVIAGTEKRVIKIGESTFAKGDRSSLKYTRDENGNWEFVTEHGDIEEVFIITYDRTKKTGKVKGFPSDVDPSKAKAYAELNCE